MVVEAVRRLNSLPGMPDVCVRQKENKGQVWEFSVADVVSEDVAGPLEAIITNLIQLLEDVPDPKELEVQFDVSGTINQTIQITDPSIEPDELLGMLQGGAAFTSVSVGAPVMQLGGSEGLRRIGVVSAVESTSEYSEFQKPGLDTTEDTF